MKELYIKIIIDILASLALISNVVLYFTKVIDLDNLMLLVLGTFAIRTILYEMDFSKN